MVRSVSIRDVATVAGVSVGTVSNVLNRAEVVRPETRERVEKAIRELGFVRSEAARQLRAGHSRSVGLLVLDVTNPFFTDLARGVEDHLADAGLSMILGDSNGDERREQRYLTLFDEQRVQGVLVVPVGRAARVLTALRGRDIPVVLLDAKAPDRTVCSVSVDDVGGGRSAVAHLIGQGHSRIAFVGGEGRERQVADRAKGARAAMHTAGLAPDHLHVVRVEALSFEGGRAAAAQLLGLPGSRRPTAAFCANDLLAFGMLQELTHRGVRVPDDMALVGYDDIVFAAAAAVPLSSVRQPCQEMARAAGELLLEEASGAEHKHQRVMLRPQLVTRRSSGAD
jgi:LacI family transcriptional regulator